MTSDDVERKLAAILSADVVGYSRLMAEDEVSTVETLAAYRDVVGMLVRRHRGRVVDAPGDNVLAEFPAALDAVQAAMEIQRVIQARNTAVPADRKMEFRIGVHLGDVIVEGEEIYGEGVNIAARLEGLAHPGGICISDMVYKQVQRKLSLAYEDLGKRKLKNIPDAVQAYRVRLESEASIPTESLPGIAELTVPGFGGRPAIAVLPFDNLSGDPEQEYFADGIAEDLTTRLSSWRWFPVIARNSSFVYKKRAVDVRQISRELGVRYLVEGSVRKVGDRVRVSAQLIDATTGGHVWAERYDRELSDILTLQDEIIEAIVASMAPELSRFESDRRVQLEPEGLNAWDCFIRGRWHLNQLTKDDNRKARSLFERAIELDPHFSEAFCSLALTHFSDILLGSTGSAERSAAETLRAAQRAVTLDPKNPYSHVTLGVAYSLTGQQEEMISALELSSQFNPSLSMAYAYLGIGLALAGRPDEAIARLEKAMRLSPRDPSMWRLLYSQALAHFAAGRYEHAVNWAHRSIERKPDFSQTHFCLAASYAHLDQLDEARAALREGLRLAPISLASARVLMAAAAPDFVKRMIEGIRKAGLEE